MKREELIQYIVKHDSFYRLLDFDAHTDEELLQLKKRIEQEAKKKQTIKK